jgi:DNA-binding PadR family transcriptional regulator
VSEQIDRSILVVRGQKVLLDEQLAGFYGVPTKALVQAVKRNIERFPEDFAFQLTGDEWGVLKPQLTASNLRSQSVTSSSASHGGRRYAPYAFTEQGVAMLSSVLRNPRAVELNIQIMRAFVRLRQLLSLHKELAERLMKLEEQMRERDHAVAQQFQQVFALLDQLFNPPSPPRNRIGFHTE